MSRLVFSLRALLSIGAAAAALAGCSNAPLAEVWAPADVRSVAFSPMVGQQDTVGELTFAGGIELIPAKTAGQFGGLSGLSVSEDGAFVAVTDAGGWVRGRIVLDASGRLASVADIQMAAMRDANGAPIRDKRHGDAEDITRLADGRYAVSFEQLHRVFVYDLAGKGPQAAAQAAAPIGGASALLANEGLEAMTQLTDGRLLAVAEAPPSGTRAPFWLLDPNGGAVTHPAGAVAMEQGFAAVGLTRLPNGDVVQLERYFLPLVGVKLHVRHIKAENLTAAKPSLEGRVIASLETPMALDNFESISVVARPNGQVRFYILSDDNFSPNQKTHLLAFDWTPPADVLIAAVAPQAAPDAVEAAASGEAPAPQLAAAPPAIVPAPTQMAAVGGPATRVSPPASAPAEPRLMPTPQAPRPLVNASGSFGGGGVSAQPPRVRPAPPPPGNILPPEPETAPPPLPRVIEVAPPAVPPTALPADGAPTRPLRPVTGPAP